jgi:hypothetical protein
MVLLNQVPHGLLAAARRGGDAVSQGLQAGIGPLPDDVLADESLEA